MLKHQEEFQRYVNRELHEPGPAGFGMYLYFKKLLATYEDSGLGTFTHETMHAFAEKDFKGRPGWANEGIPTFFEKFYGYWDGRQLVLFWGYQNPWRIGEIGDDLTRLDLAKIISNESQYHNESQERMVSLFLWEPGRFGRFLRLIAANEKGGYKSFLEAAMDL